MARGDHIYVSSSVGGIPFQHHGIDMGDGTVIHLAPVSGPRVTLRDRSGEFSVRRDNYDDFCRGEQPQVVAHANARQAEETARAAEESLGRTGYSLLDGNCEHFATSCATGRSESHQIEMGEATVSAMASMATKAFWALSSKIGGGMALRTAIKVHPATMLADGVEIAALALGCQSGFNAKHSRQLAKVSGTVAAAGIGTLVGGPVGAATCLAAHTSSAAVADRACRYMRRLLA